MLKSSTVGEGSVCVCVCVGFDKEESERSRGCRASERACVLII